MSGYKIPNNQFPTVCAYFDSHTKNVRYNFSKLDFTLI